MVLSMWIWQHQQQQQQPQQQQEEEVGHQVECVLCCTNDLKDKMQDKLENMIDMRCS